MKTTKLTRRQFLGLSAGSASLLAADALWIEPMSVKTKVVRLTKDQPTVRFVQFSDTHHKGDRAFLESAVRRINAIAPDFVCFTGDLIEKVEHLTEALDVLKGIKSPLYGVPGNHDYLSNADFTVIDKAFITTGGRWLLNENVLLNNGKINLIGSTCNTPDSVKPMADKTNLLMMHFPVFVEKLAGKNLDLMMAGHSHGGQVRLPVVGAIVLPKGTGAYDLGLYHTASGPLYVNPGIGYLYVDVRFNCRPEITIFEV